MNTIIPDLDRIIEIAINEDLSLGDITTQSLNLKSENIKCLMISKDSGILCGNFVAKEVFKKIDNTIKYEEKLQDGDCLQEGSIISEIYGNKNSILSAERIALNFMQRMSGVATLTNEYVTLVDTISISDTRKTIPGWRNLDKYSVKCGGGFNHRRNLGDGVLIKDNHIEAARKQNISIKDLIDISRKNSPHTIKIEIEVDNFDLLDEAIESAADIIMLDNMTDEQIIKSINRIKGKKLVEVSGNVDKNRLVNLNKISGIDIISVGKLTHSAKALDISLNFT
ncbi:MAG: carboxylating nicotinate-nucleotide diphosphorylase [SAR202 cluster bacterium]|nr:MAG: carboxylating nicotinate-nucleotide diphosphorylase [SAR202 cluster bacterium]